MKVILTEDALRDLTFIRFRVSLDNSRAAVRPSRRLAEACESLAEFPERGRLGLEPGTRENVLVWPYVIVYRIVPGQVEILRVWHGAQDRA